MAVEASNLKFFLPQHIQNRDLNLIMNPCVQGNNDLMYSGIPLSTNFKPAVCDSWQPKTSVNTDSGLTYNIPVPRKRSRDCIEQMHEQSQTFPLPHKTHGVSQFPTFIGDAILPQIHQHQLEIDAIVSHHTKRIRLEIEERQKQHARLLVSAIGEGMAKKLKEKEEQIQRMGKLNFVLQDRVKSLYVENQLLRDMAQTNEATANTLRTNLEHILAHVGAEDRTAAVETVVESCCGSSGDHDEDEVSTNRKCKRCGERESSVLLLPCRHLCLCNVCGSGPHQLQACPVCNSTMNATLHVNMS